MIEIKLIGGPSHGKTVKAAAPVRRGYRLRVSHEGSTRSNVYQVTMGRHSAGFVGPAPNRKSAREMKLCSN